MSEESDALGLLDDEFDLVVVCYFENNERVENWEEFVNLETKKRKNDWKAAKSIQQIDEKN